MNRNRIGSDVFLFTVLFTVFCLNLPFSAKVSAQESEIPENNDSGISRKGKSVFLPRGNLFSPLIADLKEPRFSASFIYYNGKEDNFLAGVAAFGERLNIFRYSPFGENEGFQIGLDAGIVSLFNFESSSINLINADYYGGIPISWRYKNWSMRLRPYHQSSHLGDEFLLTTPVNRINLSYEAIDFLNSFDWKTLRFYAGPEFLMRREPVNLDRWMIHGGVEWVGSSPLFGRAYPQIAVDLKSYEEHNFFVNTSAKAGISFRKSAARFQTERKIALNMEFYYGYSPYGQFYNEKLLTAGLGASFGF